jgi:hypothetical protein
VVGTDPAPPPPPLLAPLPGKEEVEEEGMVLFLRNPKLIGLKGGSMDEEEEEEEEAPDVVPEN